MCNRSLRLSRVVGISGEFFMQTNCEISVLNTYLPLYIYGTKSLLTSQIHFYSKRERLNLVRSLV